VAPQPEMLRVLLAEDNHVNQIVAARMLEKRGHVVTVAQTGPNVLRAIERERFDVILMDVHMPEMDGLQVTEVIRRKETLTGEHIPIVALTASAMRGDREKCLAAGMDDYVSKPVRSEVLLECLRAVMLPQRASKVS
jgi:two-component system, sensor histidine kinase and response regulator